MKIDLKSAVVGLLVGVVAVFAMGAGEPGSTIGKYQIAGGSGFFVIVDTETGKSWAANLASPVPGFQSVHPGFWDKKPER